MSQLPQQSIAPSPGASSSSPTPVSFTDEKQAREFIAHLQGQLAVANEERQRMVTHMAGEQQKMQATVASAQAQMAAAKSEAAASRPKVNLPNVPQFKGEVGYSVDVWLRRLVKYFEYYGALQFPNDASRVKYAVMLLEGPAMDWWDNLDGDERNDIVTWEQFVDAIHNRFRPIEAATVARMRLSALKQRSFRSINEYVTAFQKELTPISDMSESDKVHYFRTGLLPSLAHRVLERGVSTLQEAIRVAVLVNEQLKVASGVTSSYHAQSSWTHRGGGHSRYGGSSSNSSSSAPMELSNLTYNGDGDSHVDESSFTDGSMHQEHESDQGSSPSVTELMSELQKLKKSLNAIHSSRGGFGKSSSSLNGGASSSSSSGSPSGNRVQLSKADYDYCWRNRLCFKCRKPISATHNARECKASPSSSSSNLKH